MSNGVGSMNVARRMLANRPVQFDNHSMVDDRSCLEAPRFVHQRGSMDSLAVIT